MAESAKLNSMWKWLPLKIEHWVHWLDFNPPGSSLESLSYNTRIVPRGNNKFVAVFYICVFKRYLTDRPFFPSPCLSCSYWLLLILVVQLSSELLCIENLSWSYVFLIENLLNFCRNLSVIKLWYIVIVTVNNLLAYSPQIITNALVSCYLDGFLRCRTELVLALQEHPVVESHWSFHSIDHVERLLFCSLV